LDSFFIRWSATQPGGMHDMGGAHVKAFLSMMDNER
jgi:hypothetical protein